LVWERLVWMEAAKGALEYYDNNEKLVPILGANVITILGTQALLVVGM